MNTDVIFPLLFGLKTLVVLGSSLYVLFALILVRQEMLMANVLEEGFEPVLRMMVYAHAIAAGAVFVLSFILL